MDPENDNSKAISALKIRTNAQRAQKQQKCAHGSQELDELEVSPSSPLLTTAVDDNGWVCGRNNAAQLGVGDWANRAKPQQLRDARRLAALSFGENHAAGVTGSGDIYTWGDNSHGELGMQGPGSSAKPTAVPALKGHLVRAVACGKEHTVALTGMEVFAWGSHYYGQCGVGEAGDYRRLPPTSIKPLYGFMVTQVVCGSYHTLCVTAISQVFAWGRNSHGQLGVGDQVERTSPTLVTELWAMPVKQLAAGDRHSAALTTNGFLFTWGANDKGQLGLPTTAEAAAHAQVSRSTSEKMRVRRRVNQRFLAAMIEMGIPKDKAELALAETGNVGVEIAAEWYFSLDPEAWDTLAESDPSTPVHDEDVGNWVGKPKRVALQGVTHIAAGASHTVAITDGTVYAWGCNDEGQLGLGHCRNTNQPGEVTTLAGKHVTQVACGTSHTIFLCIDGTTYGCGAANHGQLPISESRLNPDTTPLTRQPTPVRLVQTFLRQGTKACGTIISAVAAGGDSTAFLTRAQAELPEPNRHGRLLTRLVAALDRAVEGPDSAPTGDNPSARLGQEAYHKEVTSISNAVQLVFSSAAALSAAFGHKDKVGMDVVALDDFQNKVLRLQDRVGPCTPRALLNVGVNAPPLPSLYKATCQLLDDLYRNVRLLCTPERAQVLLAAAQSPLLARKDMAVVLIPKLTQCILSSPSSTRHLLVKWWAEYPGELLEERVVAPLQQYLTTELYATKKLTLNVMNVIKVLAKLEEANTIGRQLPPEAFYNDLVSEKLDVYDHYIAWRQTHDMPQQSINGEGPFSFCSYPFLLNPRAKSKLLHVEAKIHQDQCVQACRQEASGGSRPSKATAATAGAEERVLPRKPRALEGEPSGGAFGDEDFMRGARRRGEGRGLRGLFFNMLRNNNDVEEANPREASARIPDASQSLIRHGSMNLPPPERSGIPGVHPEMCIIRVRRSHLSEDALNEIARQNPRDINKPLRVVFIGEDGIDAGGVKKEFFQLLIAELLCPDYGMLVFMPESRTYWFNPCTLEAEAEFLLVGLVLGLAIYNGVILDFPLPLALYKRLLGLSVTLRDLEDMQPTLGRSLKQLLTYEGPGTIEDVFCQTFVVEVPAYGTTHTIPLKPGGEDIAVTEDNRQEFVDLYVKFWLHTSIENQFEAFCRGFMMLCGGPALHLFSATELERLVCGNPLLDFAALQSSAKYEGGYNAEHECVTWLWEIVHELNPEEQRRFLKFFTGSDRAPIGGLGNLRCIIQRDGPDSTKLPTSHTCFNTLLLPSYSSKERMAERLKLAIMNAEGFGLE